MTYEVVGVGGYSKSPFQVGSYHADQSYIVAVRPYPTNVERTTVKTFSKSAGSPVPIPGIPPPPPSMATVTIEMNSSMLLLPEKPMMPRYMDNRVGYFGTSYTDFDANPQGVKNIDLIARWRMEQKQEEMDKYKKGELGEQIKQIEI